MFLIFPKLRKKSIILILRRRIYVHHHIIKPTLRIFIQHLTCSKQGVYHCCTFTSIQVTTEQISLPITMLRIRRSLALSQLLDNASERGVRKIKIKQKVSGCFRTDSGADDFAKLHSIAETAMKNGNSKFNAILAVVQQ